MPSVEMQSSAASNGCIEERQTYEIDNYDSVDLSKALDLDIDRVPDDTAVVQVDRRSRQRVQATAAAGIREETDERAADAAGRPDDREIGFVVQ